MDSVMPLVNLQQDTDRRWMHDALTKLSQKAARSTFHDFWPKCRAWRTVIGSRLGFEAWWNARST